MSNQEKAEDAAGSVVNVVKHNTLKHVWLCVGVCQGGVSWSLSLLAQPQSNMYSIDFSTDESFLVSHRPLRRAQTLDSRVSQKAHSTSSIQHSVFYGRQVE